MFNSGYQLLYSVEWDSKSLVYYVLATKRAIRQREAKQNYGKNDLACNLIPFDFQQRALLTTQTGI